MIAHTILELQHHRAQTGVYVQCRACGMHQTRDFDNPCMYCGSTQFRRVYESYDEYHENRA